MNRASRLGTFVLLSVLASGCTPPPVSIYMIRDTAPPGSEVVDINGVGYYMLDSSYSLTALNQRLDLATEVTLLLSDGEQIQADRVSVTLDSVLYSLGDETGGVLVGNVAQLSVYDETAFYRGAHRALITGGILGGCAALAYIPPNPPNEPPISTVPIMFGVGAAPGVAMGDLSTQREVIVFVREARFY